MKKQVGEEEMEDDVEEKRLCQEALPSMSKGYRIKYIFAIYTSKQSFMGFIHIAVMKMSS